MGLILWRFCSSVFTSKFCTERCACNVLLQLYISPYITNVYVHLPNTTTYILDMIVHIVFAWRFTKMQEMKCKCVNERLHTRNIEALRCDPINFAFFAGFYQCHKGALVAHKGRNNWNLQNTHHACSSSSIINLVKSKFLTNRKQSRENLKNSTGINQRKPSCPLGLEYGL